jgi:hypothetical protein
MKIKDIVMKEDGSVTVSAVSGDKAKLSNGQEIDAKSLTPDAEHPGQFKAPQVDPTAIKPGAPVTMTDQETSEDMPVPGVQGPSIEKPNNTNTYPVSLKSGTPLVLDNGNSGGTPLEITRSGEEVTPQMAQSPDNKMNRVCYLNVNGKLYMALNTGHKYKIGKQSFQDIQAGGQQHEVHHDLISQGNYDVGGDATDSFNSQVIDKAFTRANRNSPGQGTRSTLPESDELSKWLTIAGIR